MAEHFLSDEKLEDMIIAQGMLVFFAGNDTTSSTLAIVCYRLAEHQDLQEKKRQVKHLQIPTSIR